MRLSRSAAASGCFNMAEQTRGLSPLESFGWDEAALNSSHVEQHWRCRYPTHERQRELVHVGGQCVVSRVQRDQKPGLLRSRV